MVRTFVLAAAVLGFAGCGMNPGTISGPAPVKGRVVLPNGQPAKDVLLVLQPAGHGLQVAHLKVGADGRFTGEAVAGQYLYLFDAQPGKTVEERQRYQAAIQAIPPSYRETSNDHMVKVGEGDLELKLTK